MKRNRIIIISGNLADLGFFKQPRSAKLTNWPIAKLSESDNFAIGQF